MLVIQSAAGQNVQPSSSIFVDGEWLSYKVKWGFIRLGTVEITQQRVDSLQPERFVVKITGDSRPLPFIDVYFINESVLDPTRPVNENFNLFLGREQQRVTTYSFDKVNRKIYMALRENGALTATDTLYDKYIAYDAGGVLMMMRMLCGYDTTAYLPTLSEFQLKGTDLVFTDEAKLIKVSAIDTPILARYFEGIAHWVGTSWAGVRGPFSGWISADEAAVSLKINMKIFLGSITLELEEFHREERQPGGKETFAAKKSTKQEEAE